MKMLTRTFLPLALGLALTAQAADSGSSFTLRDIEVQGLQNIASGTVFTYLPYRVGDQFAAADSTRVIQELYKTGFFRRVEVARRGDVLVVQVEELPTIGELKISGNEKVETPDLEKALKSAGLAKGRVLNRQALEQMQQELQRLYFSMGLYGVEVNAKQTELDGNRIALEVDILEGTPSSIRSINIVGNKAFNEKELLGQFELGPTSWYQFLSDSDQYSRQKLAADIEKLRSFYLDRGYLKFSVDSTQVNISPDKKDIDITLAITEGVQYSVSAVDFAGTMILPEDELRKFVTIKTGERFSRKALTESTTALVKRLGNEGYAFANVNPVPEIDESSKSVKITLYVDPGKRVYVRRINIAGNFNTDEEVFRREMRQMEGAWFSGDKVERSKERLQRLSYVESASIETKPVPGVADQVDLNVGLTERLSGSFSVGVGYSQSEGVLFNVGVSQANFLGTGNNVNFNIERSGYRSLYSLSYLDPYWTVDGVSRGFSLYYRETKATQLSLSRYLLDAIGGDLKFGIPLSEHTGVRLAVGAEQSRLKTTDQSPTWVNSRDFTFFTLTPSWYRDTRDRVVFPNRGGYSLASMEFATPGSSVEYYKVNLSHDHYLSLSTNYVFKLGASMGYGDTYGKVYKDGAGDEYNLPPFRNYYAGGIRSVRGFEDYSLSSGSDTLDSNGDPLGGSFKLVGGAELIFPLPFLGEESANNVRMSVFYDVGNVYSSYDTFAADELRMSAGVSVIWLSPIGPLTLSLAQPLNDKPGDRTQVFQFAIGAGF
ncbi:MAG: outer membrane protein assembly factor BamA [Pseudomonadota bacterium]